MQIEIVSVMWVGLIKHSGLKITLPSGHQYVYANSPQHGVARQSLADFAVGRPITSARYEGCLPAALVIARAEKMLGQQYSLLDWNCDHFVSAALGFAPESKQLQVIFWALAGTLLLSRMAA